MIRQAGIYRPGIYRPAIYGRSTGVAIETLRPILVTAALAPPGAAQASIPAGAVAVAMMPDPVAGGLVAASSVDVVSALPITIIIQTALPAPVIVTGE